MRVHNMHIHLAVCYIITVTPSKLVSLSASKNSSSHSRSLYWKSAMVRFRIPLSCEDWCTLRATSCMANAAVHTPSYVYPWNREYSSPRLMSYSCWYSLEVCVQHDNNIVCRWFVIIIIKYASQNVADFKY